MLKVIALRIRKYIPGISEKTNARGKHNCRSETAPRLTGMKEKKSCFYSSQPWGKPKLV